MLLAANDKKVRCPRTRIRLNNPFWDVLDILDQHIPKKIKTVRTSFYYDY